MTKQTKIVVDAMGGDYAPQQIIEGAVGACREYRTEIILVGQTEQIKHHLKKIDATYLPISIKHAEEVVTMEDNPLDVIRKKKNSSIRVGLELITQKKADAFVSAGNSGAVASGALFVLKRIKGIERPAIAAVMPAVQGHVVVADAGANNAVKPFNLVQFAIMSSVYCKYAVQTKNPRIAILSNGEEDTKGTDAVRAANNLLKNSSLHYIGCVEGSDVLKGKADVVICDGFTGNVLLKVAEGVAEGIGKVLKEEIKRSYMARLGYLFTRKAFTALKKKFDYAEYGAAPLLGVSAPVFIAHGKSNAIAIKNAIRSAKEFTESEVIYHIQHDLEVNKDLQSVGKKPSFIDRLLHSSKAE